MSVLRLSDLMCLILFIILLLLLSLALYAQHCFDTDYEIEVTTTDKQEGGTIHNGWLILKGNKGTSKVFVLNNSARNKILRR